jgi:uncharacterized delta-60 repeat protein
MKKILLLFVLTAIRITSFSQAGSLDLSFGNKGFIRTNFEPDDVYAYFNRCGPILRLPDGSFYLVIEMNHQTFITHRLPDGKLDSSYAENGYSAPVLIDEPTAVIQPDGKILIGGTSVVGIGDFALARFRSDGQLDHSFSADGIQTTDFSGWRDKIHGLTLQADGKILAVGTSGNSGPEKVAVARYHIDGSADDNFSDDGKLTTDIFGFDRGASVAMQSDGKFIVAGSSYNNSTFVRSMSIYRYLPDGTLDSTFSEAGIQLISIGWETWGASVIVQSDGKILVAGTFWNNRWQALLIRLNSDGILDHSFSDDGIVVTNYGPMEAVANNVAIQDDGKIIVSGGAVINRMRNFAIARYNTNGSLDNSFSGDGVDIPNIRVLENSDEIASSLIFLPGGKIMIGGAYRNNFAFAVVRYQPDGKLDASFGDDGILRDHKPGWYVSFNASAMQPDGKIVTAGSAGYPLDLPKYFVVSRFKKDGTPDNTFSEDGKLMSNFGFSAGGAYAVAIQPDGKVLVAGTAFNGKDKDFALVRLNADGTLDNSFSDDGKLLTDLTGYDEDGKAIILQPDGKIILGGSSNIWQLDYDFALARYNPDGSPDTTFSTDGKLTTNLFTAWDQLSTIMLQPDGKLIAVGIANQDIGVARYDKHGSPDLSFDGDGIVITDVSGIGDRAYGAVLQPDQKIVIAGGTASDFLFIRYNNDGSLDKDFSGDGKFVVDMGTPEDYYSEESATSILIQADGKLVAGGHSSPNFTDFALIRVNANGSLDSSFSGDGKMVMDFGYGNDFINSMLINGNRLYATGSTTYGGMMPVITAFLLDDGNQPPIAGAWFQKYYNPTTALLAAWGSSDPEGGPISYWWEKTAGPAGSGILYANSASPVITALVDGTYAFRLTVTDNQGATGTASVSFTVSNNLPPIAGAWLQKYYSPISVLLAAWDSHDPEGGPITYFWEKTAGPEGSTLLYGNSASPVINGLVNGTYTFRLTVTDNQGATGWKELTFTVSGVPLSSNRSQSLMPNENSNSNNTDQFIVYPNPVKDILNLRWINEYTGVVMLTVMDISGRKIKDVRINKTAQPYNGSVELTGLKPGQYYLHIRNENKTFTRTFIKE